MGKAGAVAIEIPASSYPYSVHSAELNRINAEKDAEALKGLGGVPGLASALESDLQHGLDDSSQPSGVNAHRAAYGDNSLPEKTPPSFLRMLFEAAKDPMIIILLIVAVVVITVGAAVPEQRAHNGWSEGLAVFGTALIVVFIGAAQDFSKEKQFQKLNALKDVVDVKVLRSGKQVVVHNNEVVVGDVVFLDTGDKIVADGVVVDSQGMVIDEASLTGESDPIKKDTVNDPWVRSGTTVNEGSGHMLVTAVGVNSEWGKTMTLVAEAGDDQTPLQEQLTRVAAFVSKVGVLVGVTCFIALLVKWLVETKGGDASKINTNGPLQFLLYSITIIVVSIPEGLPLAVTLTLAYSMKKMMKDNNFVRVLSACETMGGATAICSDKTGTLTENRMTVVEGWFAGTVYTSVPEPQALKPELLDLLKNNAALNSKAFLVDQPSGLTDFVGNRTECALLVLLRKLGFEYTTIREDRAADQIKLYGFSSARKMASVLVRESADTLRLYNKGAAEWVLRRCEAVVGPDGSLEPMTDAKLQEMMGIVTGMAMRGLRCICLSYRDYPAEDAGRPADFFEDPDQVDHGLVAYAIVGIKDPVRKEVPGAVQTCQRAGIVVRMVTGDNIHTAQHIARECGILVDDCIALEGPVFRAMPAAEVLPLLPRLRVLARSSPEDKLVLVGLLKQQGEVVAVTGDGTNDAPALKESDVGLAMGITGTEVAKEAADIIIMDDNFSSIVKAVLWGRCVYENIRKFLVFQLSINLVAMISAAVGALVGGVPPLNVLQLLWVNMIMDTLAALALATEEPYAALLDDPPHGRTESLITATMYLHMITAAIYKLFWLFACLYGLPRVLPAYAVLGETEFYRKDCANVLQDKGYSAAAIPDLCNWMSYCGFPRGADLRQTLDCNLYVPWRDLNTTAVPSNGRDAVCRATGGDCPMYDLLSKAQKDMDKEFDYKLLESYKPALSVLFNAFILAQVANAFVSRRVKYELDFFTGLARSPIFLIIMFFISVMQVIIMQTPVHYIFKVQALNGPEWGATIAIGAGAIPFSMAVRWAVRSMLPLLGGETWLAALRGKRVQQITASGAAPMKAAASRRRLLSEGPTSSSHGRTVSSRGVGRTVSGVGAGRTISGAVPRTQRSMVNNWTLPGHHYHRLESHRTMSGASNASRPVGEETQLRAASYTSTPRANQVVPEDARAPAPDLSVRAMWRYTP